MRYNRVAAAKQNELIRSYLSALNCPRALTVWLLYSHNEHEQLVNLDFDPKDYLGSGDALDALASTKLLSKAKFLNTGINCEEVALAKFHEAEAKCRETNRRIHKQAGSSQVEAVIAIAQRKIASVLGSVTGSANCSYDTERFLEEFIRSCDHGPGATLLIKRRDASKPLKFDFENQICSSGYEFVRDWFHEAWPHWQVYWDLVDHSNIVTVPKNAKTDRVIAIEPGMSLWFQKGIGRMIRRRLRRVGLDLEYQQEVNQLRSRHGSKTNNLATIDFSAASDTISRSTVELLLPRDWVNLLSAFRSPSGKIGDGQPFSYEKFSSMGNGFTFELETLIFHCLALACCKLAELDDSEVTTFGDDVILPTGVVNLYRNVCEYLGFKVNESKSYSDSYFRESCGAYWHNGYDIKPFFLKETISNATQVQHFANNVRSLASRRLAVGGDNGLLDCWRLSVQYLGELTRICPVPPVFGDVGLHVDLDEIPMYSLQTPRRATHQQEAWWVKVWAPVALSKYSESYGLYLSKLQEVQGLRANDYLSPTGIREPSSLGNDVPLPGRTRMAKIRIWVPQWPDTCPFLY